MEVTLWDLLTQTFNDVPVDFFWLLAILVIAYLFAMYRYWCLARDSSDRIRLAPISVKGGILKDLRPYETGLILRAQLSAILETFRAEHSFLYTAEAIGDHFRSINTALVSVPMELGLSEIEVKKEAVVKVGVIEIPIGAIMNLLATLLHIVPIPFRRRYLASLTHVALVSIGDETQLLVYREGGGLATKGRVQVEGNGPPTSRVIVLAETKPVKKLSEITDMLRDATFMVLQQSGKAFPQRNWLGMRNLTDGLEVLDEYRKTADERLVTKAKESFSRSVVADPDNFEALYFYGSLLLLDRNRESIAMAIKVFNRTLKTEVKKLRAFANAGLANCYAQGFHRLAKSEIGVLKKAQDYAERAWQDWIEAEPNDLNPWILSTLALVKHIDEGNVETREDAKKRFLDSTDLYLQAIEKEPDNGIFHNNLGWVMLKLAEWGVEDLKPEDGIPRELSGNPAEMARKYFNNSLNLNEKNKLTHSNLCLLYATPWYRKRRDKKYLDQCHYHGLMAIRLDPKYINGHRDFTLSLIRYGEFNEAYTYFEKALQLSTAIEKDQEIIGDAVKVLEEMKVHSEELERWRHPHPRLLRPPGF